MKTIHQKLINPSNRRWIGLGLLFLFGIIVSLLYLGQSPSPVRIVCWLGIACVVNFLLVLAAIFKK